MDLLWAPWRMSYILTASKGGGCIFCDAVNSSDDEASLVLYRSKYSIVMLNKYPYNTAHVMIAPKRHVPRPDLLTDEESLDLHRTLSIVLKSVDIEYKPQGFNVGMNIGRVAGAGVEAHMHIHVVPRWSGDSNYMPIVGNVKVIPEDLTQTYRRLRKAITQITERMDV